MKIIKLLYIKYTLSFLICLSSSFVIFFIFSLISNLSEDYIFKVILTLSALNSLQILTYVPAFVFLISVILFSVFLRSRNEVLIIKSYLSFHKLMFFIMPIVLVFSIFEGYKKYIAIALEDNKSNLIKSEEKNIKTKILINETNTIKKITILENLDKIDMNNAKYRSYNISNKSISTAEYSEKFIASKNSLTLLNYTQYENDVIENFNSQKIININFFDLISSNSLVKIISVKSNSLFNIKLANLITFYIFFLCFIFLIFFDSKHIGSKQNLRYPILISLSMLIYSFIIFNNSLVSYKIEFELLASFIAFMLFFKAYTNE